MPPCAVEMDRQLRRVLVDPRHGNSPLLGDASDGQFVLGYMQCSQMPVPLREKGLKAADKQLAHGKPQKEGRSLGLHFDSLPYGDVIITLTVFGTVCLSQSPPPCLAFPMVCLAH